MANALATPAPAASPRARSTAANATGWSGLNGSVSVCVISTSGANSRIPSAIARSASRVDLERIVAEVEAVELGAERGRRRALGLAVADLLDLLDRLALLLPQLAGLAALAVGERDHLAAPPPAAVTATAPPARQTKSAEWAPITMHPAGSQWLRPGQPARVGDRHDVTPPRSPKPAASNRSTISAMPSSTGGLNTWPRSVDSTVFSAPVARMLVDPALPRHLPGVRGREAALEQRAALGQRELVLDRTGSGRGTRDG